jgi:hypothetical protein
LACISGTGRSHWLGRMPRSRRGERRIRSGSHSAQRGYLQDSNEMCRLSNDNHRSWRCCCEMAMAYGAIHSRPGRSSSGQAYLQQWTIVSLCTSPYMQDSDLFCDALSGGPTVHGYLQKRIEMQQPPCPTTLPICPPYAPIIQPRHRHTIRTCTILTSSQSYTSTGPRTPSAPPWAPPAVTWRSSGPHSASHSSTPSCSRP